MKKIFFTLGLFAVAIAAKATPTSSSVVNLKPGENNLLNTCIVAIKQRYLSQKAAKAYIYLAAKGTPDPKLDNEMKLAATMFESNIVILKSSNLNTDGQALLAKEEAQWASFNAVISSSPDVKNAEKMINAANAVLEAANNLALHMISVVKAQNVFKVDTGVTKEDLLTHINIAARNRSLSQRMCMFYIAYTKNLIAKETAWQSFLACFNEIDRNMTYMFTSLMNNIHVDEMVAMSIRDWNVLKKIDLQEYQDSKVTTDLIYDKTIDLLYSSDDIMTVYKDFIIN